MRARTPEPSRVAAERALDHDHIVELECRRAGERAETASLRTEVSLERVRTAQAETQASEANARASEVEHATS